MPRNPAGAVQYFDLSACKGIKVKRRGESRCQEIRPEICHFSRSVIMLEHDCLLEYAVGEKIDLQIDLGARTQTFRGRVASIVRETLRKDISHKHIRCQYITELESEMPSDLFHHLSSGARRSWWLFAPGLP